MPSRPIRLAAALLTSWAVACTRHVEPVQPVQAPWPSDEHCWWVALRTTLPVDSVGARFTRAYTTLGLVPVRSTRVGDTVLVRGGPTPFSSGRTPGRYASRLVAFQQGDSARFRWYWAIQPLDGGPAADTTAQAGRGIGFCGEIGKLVAIQGWAPRDPSHDDSLDVWKRVP